MARALKDSLYVPLSVHVLDDETLNGVSALAQLIYLQGLALAKRTASDGVVTARQVRRQLLDVPLVLNTDDETDASEHATASIGELVKAGLWEPTDDGYLIAGWFKHNPATATVRKVTEATRRKQAEAAHRTNHKLGRHDPQPVDDCPECSVDRRSPNGLLNGTDDGPLDGTDDGPTLGLQDEKPGDRQGDGGAKPLVRTVEERSNRRSDRRSSERSTDGPMTEAEAEAEAKKKTLPTPVGDTQEGAAERRSGGGEESPSASEVAGHCTQLLANEPTPTVGELRTVERAMARGITAEQIIEAAERTAEQATAGLTEGEPIRSPRRYWCATVTKLEPEEPARRGRRRRTEAEMAEVFAAAEQRMAEEGRL